jgi:ArsR family transcriptional regulator
MDKLTDVFKILADETRLRILILLAQSDLCVCEMCGVLDLPQPKVSKHLSKLRDVGLVIDERKEKFVYYKLAKGNVTLNSIIEDIMRNIREFPQLVSDQERLAGKQVYFDRCSINLSKEA